MNQKKMLNIYLILLYVKSTTYIKNFLLINYIVKIKLFMKILILGSQGF